MLINGVQVINNGIDNLSEKEAALYVEHVMNLIKEKNPQELLKNITLSKVGDDIGIDYNLQPPKFERIRRITGYLVGTIDRWNQAKAAEEADRVKHISKGQKVEYDPEAVKSEMEADEEEIQR